MGSWGLDAKTHWKHRLCVDYLYLEIKTWGHGYLIAFISYGQISHCIIFTFLHLHCTFKKMYHFNSLVCHRGKRRILWYPHPKWLVPLTIFPDSRRHSLLGMDPPQFFTVFTYYQIGHKGCYILFPKFSMTVAHYSIKCFLLVLGLFKIFIFQLWDESSNRLLSDSIY